MNKTLKKILVIILAIFAGLYTIYGIWAGIELMTSIISMVAEGQLDLGQQAFDVVSAMMSSIFGNLMNALILVSLAFLVNNIKTAPKTVEEIEKEISKEMKSKDKKVKEEAEEVKKEVKKAEK